MPQESQLAHRVLTNLAIPYISNISPANTDPHFVPGSSDILTTINGYAERRPGFALALENTPTTFNNLQRLFPWDRFDGTFIIMACDINSSGFAQVFKLVIGNDNSFVSIWTDTSSAVPYDFVVSNNTVYFSNGAFAKKWDPVNGLSNWGIVAPTTSASTSLYSGTQADGGGPNVWTNPTNSQGPPDGLSASNTVTAPAHSFVNTNAINDTNYGFAIVPTNIITGVQVVLTCSQSLPPGLGSNSVAFQMNLVYAGSSLGTGKAGSPSGGTLTLGGPTDLWGATLSPGVINATSFGLGVAGHITNGLGGSPRTGTFTIDAVQITVFQSGGPTVTVNAAAGSMNAAAGYVYVVCYGNGATGHLSSPSLPSNNTGTFTNKLNVQIPVTASTDPQVNQIRVFRTTDGGGGTYFEIPGSPFPNTTTTVNDSAADTALILSSVAPTPTFNDPPTPGRAATYFSGRIWMFKGNKVVFSGLEEINQGVPEESFPSGIAGNFWTFDEPVQAQGVAGIGDSQTLGIFCGGRLYGIQGNTLDTFRRFLVSNRRGARNVACTSSLGGMLAWLDSANQIWATDGSSLNELSPPIRPDLTGINQENCSLTFHTAGRFHWLVFSTGTQLFVYDIDQDQWMPPWSFSAKYVISGETAPGNYVLMASIGTKALQQSTTAFNDNGVTYQPVIKTNLLSVIPDYGSRFSYIGVGSYNEPSRTGYPTTFQVTNNGQALSDFQICNDEDTAFATYTSIAANLQDTAVTFNRTNGTHLKQLVYQTTAPAARWIGMKVILANADQVDNIYELFVAYKPLGGR